ncbi:hypothetical protein EYV94_19030 [Puteibacter caeruleilacunae]|nr:hypothetical protein EYV94_19030 [Puteibacter caeruleilacunae]
MKQPLGKNKQGSFTFKSIVGGGLLRDPKITKHFRFVFFVVVLACFLIANRYASERQIRSIDAITDSIKDLRSESISIAADLMNLSLPSVVNRRVKESGIGLIDANEPPKVLVLEKED